MSLLSDLSERLRALFRGRRADLEMDDELRFHIDREVEERVRQGQDPATARREALASFGGVERIKDDVREARGVQPLEELLADARYAGRALRHNPGFTLAVVAVLGLGLGASAAVFSVVDAVLLSDLPYPSPERLVRIVEQTTPANRWALSTADFIAIRDQQTTFEAFGTVSSSDVALAGAGAPEHVSVGRVTWGYYRVLDVRAAQGRLTTAADDALGAPPVAVVTHAFAERSLGGAASAVGRAISLDGVSHTVIGVLPAGVNVLPGVRGDILPALQMRPPTRRGPFWMLGIARLKPGVTLDNATADLRAISRRLLPLYSDWKDGTGGLTPVSLRESMVGTSDGPVKLFGVAVALVLLVAIANVATLLLVRASAREHELAVRAALGASRGRLARLVVAECAVLMLLAGLVGLGIAWLAVHGIGAFAPRLPRFAVVSLDARAVLCLVSATVLSGLLVSISPVSAVLGGRNVSAKPDDRRSGTSRRTNRLRGTLVTAEFALALPLLLGAGLLLNSFMRLQHVELGYDPTNAVGVQITLPGARYKDFNAVQAFFRQLEQRARETPGFTAVGLTSSLPPDNRGSTNNFNLVDHPVPEGTAEHVSPWMAATADGFKALGVPLLDGRLPGPGDSANAPPVVVVSRSWAERYYPREHALGKQLVSGGCYDCPRTTIVGIVGDVKYSGLTGSLEAVYDPLTQSNTNSMFLVVRSGETPASVFRRVRELVGGLDGELAVVESTLQQQVDGELADPRRWTAVLGGFAAAAAVLSAMGIFGLMSYVVRQRRREMGVRLALGAEPQSLTKLVVGRGMRYALAGTAFGLGLAVLEGRWLGAMLFGVGTMDPPTVALAAAALLGTALLACWVPGLRAARIKPLEVLSSE